MLGVLLTVIGTVLEEFANSLGKYGVKHRIQSVDMLGFLTNSWSSLFFALLIIARWPYQHFAAWPTFFLRLILETINAWFTIRAIAFCSRSTFGFMRTITIPLLLLVDYLVGYSLDSYQIMGISLIVLALFFLFANHGLDRRGLFLVIMSSVLPVATISLMKFDILHGNSLELEQGAIVMVLTLYFFIQTKRRHEKILQALARPLLLSQALLHALGGVALSFSLTLIAPSVHVAAKRSTSVMAALGTGRMIFHEKKMGLKILAMAICVIGIILLVF